VEDGKSAKKNAGETGVVSEAKTKREIVVELLMQKNPNIRARQSKYVP
jgi:hypothetical protein